MDITLLVLFIVSIVISLITLIVVIVKRNDKKEEKLSKDDMLEISQLINKSINNFSDIVATNIKLSNSKFYDDVKKLEEDLNTKIKNLSDQFNTFSLNNVKELQDQKDVLTNKISSEINEYKNVTSTTLKEFNEATQKSIYSFKEELNNGLKEIREENSKKLDDINKVVNEKLETTLEKRLKESFDTVINQITTINTTVGEIKTLASDVGSLKNALTNVKTKGIIGEILLSNIIEDFLTSDQYETNFVTRPNQKDPVEFAIKLPGLNDKPLYLPVDSKFPYEPYSKLVESKTKEEAEENRKLLRKNLLTYAKSVKEKYVESPFTTDFAIIFLPLEGIYIESLNMNLFEEIKTKYNVILTGPTTFSAFINSLSIGFKTLTIQKKSAMIFNTLAKIKKEFDTFNTVLLNTQETLSKAGENLEKLVGVRTRKIVKILGEVDAYKDLVGIENNEEN